MPSIDHRPSQRSVRSAPYSLPYTSALTRSLPSPKTVESTVYKALIALASRPAYGVTLALAGTLSHSWQSRGVRALPIFGLDAETTYSVLSGHFPGIGRMISTPWDELATPAMFEEAWALSDLVEMLVQHRTVLDEDSTWLAHAVATSCLGSDELWRDMNLQSATVLHDLLHDFFTVFAARNRNALPWKKFFLLELSDRAERRVLRMPSSAPVPEYARCFGR